jgi:hypothetical protein
MGGMGGGFSGLGLGSLGSMFGGSQMSSIPVGNYQMPQYR